MHPTRCKFTCTSVRKYQNYNSDRATQPFLFEAEFQVVYANSEENKKFFASTPSGNLKLSVIREDVFVPGQEYYLDFTPAVNS